MEKTYFMNAATKTAFTVAALAVALACLAVMATAGIASAQTSGSTPISQPSAYLGIGVQGSGTFGPMGEIIPNYPQVGLVIKRSPADTAGLEIGDMIIEINGKDPRDKRNHPYPILDPEIGATFVVRIRRGDTEREVTLVAAPRPPDLPSTKELWENPRLRARWTKPGKKTGS